MMEAFDRLKFLSNYYRQRYTVIPITTARGPLGKEKKSTHPTPPTVSTKCLTVFQFSKL